MFRRVVITMVVAVIVVVAVLGSTIYYGAVHRRSRFAAEVDIVAGSSVRGIADELSRAGVILNPRLFEMMVRIRGAGEKLRAGTYRFDAGTTLMAVLEKIKRGEVVQWPLTIIEGWTIKDIEAALAGQPYLASPNVPSEFMRLTSDAGFITQLGLKGVSSIEGYLFPDTYFMTKPLAADQLIKRLIARFKEVWGSLDGGAARGTGLTDGQLVTLASIVERETGAADERPLIASVFYNRLKLGMPLQSDPTIIYGLPNFDGNLRREDMVNPHPYNTYVHPGLPPGPICSPGKASLYAVLHPAQTKYLYFVSKNNGTHLFSETVAEHEEAVRKYQIEGHKAQQ